MTMRSPIRLLLVLQVLYVACAVSTNEDVWEEDLIHTDGGSEEAETTKENVTSPPLSISGNDLKRLQEAEARLRQAAHRALKLAEVTRFAKATNHGQVDAIQTGWGSNGSRRRVNIWEIGQKKIKEADQKVKEKASKVWNKGQEIAAKTKQKVEEVATKTKQRVEKEAKAAEHRVKEVKKKVVDKAKQVKEAAVKAAHKLKAWGEHLLSGADLLAKVISIVKSGAQTLECMFKDPTLKAAISEAGKNPQKFTADTVKKLDEMIPLVLKATTPDVVQAQKMMKDVFSGRRIHAGTLISDVEGMMTKVCNVEPSLKCVKPLLHDAFGMLKSAGPSSQLIQEVGPKSSENNWLERASTSTSVPKHLISIAIRNENPSVEQRMVDWLVDVPWKQMILPQLTGMFQFVLGLLAKETAKLTEGIMKSPEMTVVMGVLDKGLEALKNSDLFKGAIATLKEAKNLEVKTQALKKIANIVQGKISFKDLAQFATGPEARMAVMTPLSDWVNSYLPQWYNAIADTAIGLVMKAASFVVEEILAEPYPLTMWGMEAIGSAVMEVIKSAMVLIKQQGSNMLAMITNWIITAVVNVVFDGLHFVANSAATLADHVMDALRNVLKPFAAKVQEWVGDVKSFIKSIPPDIINAVVEIAKFVYDNVMAAFAPQLKTFLSWRKNTFLALKQQVCGAAKEVEVDIPVICTAVPGELELIQTQADLTEGQLVTGLKGALVFSPRLPDHYNTFVSFEEYSKEHSSMPWAQPDENGHGGIHRSSHAHQPKANALLVIVRDLHSKHHSRASAKQVNYNDMKGLQQLVQETLPNGHSILDMLQTMQHPDVSKAHGRFVQTELAAIRTMLAESQDHLSKTDYIAQMIDFAKQMMSTFECLFRATTEKLKIIKSKVDGQNAHQAMATMFKVVEDDFHKMCGLLGRHVKSTLKKISKQEDLGAGAFMKIVNSPVEFNNMIINGMKDFAQIEPSIACIAPLVSRGLNAITGLEQQLMDQATHFFDEYVVSFGMKVWDDMVIKSLDSVTALLTGDKATFQQLMMMVQSNIAKLIESAEQAMNKVLHTLTSMTPGPAKDKIVETLRGLLNGKITISDLLPMGFRAMQSQLVMYLSKQLSKLLPPAWDAVMNIVGMLGLPAAGTGLNIGIATGSCASEWVSTGLVNIIQQVYSWIVTTGKSAFFAAGKFLISTIINTISEAMNAVFDFVITPINNNIVKPVDTFVTSLVNKIVAEGEKIVNKIPKPVINLMTRFFEMTIKQLSDLFAPGLTEKIALWKDMAEAFVIGNPTNKLQLSQIRNQTI